MAFNQHKLLNKNILRSMRQFNNKLAFNDQKEDLHDIYIAFDKKQVYR